MIVGTVCMSHSPLKDRNRPSPEIEARFNMAVDEAAKFVDDQKPDLTIIFYPDHQNGFFYNLLPSFCIGIEGTSIGDYGTPSGKLDIPEEAAASLARSVLDYGVDAAISHDMHVDHGAIQPLEWLSKAHSVFRVIPIFVNCTSAPMPTFSRVRALGRAVGEWAQQASERILIVGSGGLSHDPPIPALANATPEIRSRLITGAPLNLVQRHSRQNNAHREGNAMAAGQSSLRPANPAWDRELLDAFLAGDLSTLDQASHTEILEVGGRGGHETRTWIAALSALGENYCASELFYEAIDEWITGMGIMVATKEDQPLDAPAVAVDSSWVN